ncbi:hypothetical protein B7P43_G10417 [Cryptotermes secundus]|uniref:Endonuclease/exonuclease/phosphatase domain-containing protein n=1 Tax=Cryptotermes secundus TaxID=105785 RepID=A0A2J7PX95_9NEOP|nr:hypothetical protein B7P43_G10417 [Cryptotermes secundus]
MLLEQLDSYKLDITAIQELRWLGKGVMEKRDHVVLYSCQKKSHMFGTGYIVNKKRKHLILAFQAKSHRTCRLRILHAKKKREYDKQELIELEHLRSSDEIREFYQKLNKSQKDFQSRTTLCRDKEGMILSSDEAILERRVQYFEELLNGNASERVEGMTIDCNEGNFEVEEPAPTIKEVEHATKKLKNNEAPGMDLIMAELVKFAGPEYAKHLHQLIVKIWITEIPYLRMYRPHIFCQKFKRKIGVRLIFEIFEITLHLKKNYIHN